MTSAIDNIYGSTAATASNGDQKQNASDSVEQFQQYLDRFRLQGAVKVEGLDGDDTIEAEGHSVEINGGAGNDTITASGHNVSVNGGAGDDVIKVQGSSKWWDYSDWLRQHVRDVAHNGASDQGGQEESEDGEHHHAHSIMAARTHGGEGNDIIDSDGFSWVFGEEGDDTITLGGGRAMGGSGDDVITSNGGSVEMHGGVGDDTLTATGRINVNSTISGGEGDDTIYASGTRLTVLGGTGDDDITLDGADDIGMIQMTPDGIRDLNMRSTVSAGIGDDNIKLTNDVSANIEYFVGDGTDTLSGATETSTLKLGAGLTFDTTTFTIDGNNLVLGFTEAGGGITITDYATQGVPVIEFADGRMLDASTTITYAGGDPGGYSADDAAGGA